MEVRNEYDFLGAKKNPYAKKIKRQLVTMKVDCTTIDYFKNQAEQMGIPYQTLINLYLSDCVKQNRKLHIVRK